MIYTFRMLLGILCVCIHLTVLNAQDGGHNLTVSLPEVTIMDIEGNTSIGLSPSAPVEAGLGLDFSEAKDKSLWLNYSSIIGSSSGSRRITARIANGSIPGGMKLRLRATEARGDGDGELGIPRTTRITLNEVEKNVITNIGSCYTGDGLLNGHKLKYFLLRNDDDYGELDFDESGIVEVLYTITSD